MRFENIKLEGIGIDDDSFDWEIPATDELVGLSNVIRSRAGNEDLVGTDYDNDVYYNYYLICDLINDIISMQFSVSNGEKDDFCCYEIDLFPEEKEMLMWKAIKELNKELLK